MYRWLGTWWPTAQVCLKQTSHYPTFVCSCFWACCCCCSCWWSFVETCFSGFLRWLLSVIKSSIGKKFTITDTQWQLLVPETLLTLPELTLFHKKQEFTKIMNYFIMRNICSLNVYNSACTYQIVFLISGTHTRMSMIIMIQIKHVFTNKIQSHT